MAMVIHGWERCVLAGLYLSVALLGIGRVEIFSTGVSMSAWSVSRTTLFFWVVLKLVILVRSGWWASGLGQLGALKPLYLFFLVVTVSLLPDLRLAGDYRYFFFGCAHAVMMVDVFSGSAHKRWLPVLLGVLPLVLVVRGLAHDPSVLDLSLSHRFSYPLDHPNTAGYLFAMSLPWALYVATTDSRWRRGLGAFSGAGQMVALVLTFSRGAWLGWSVAFVYLAAAFGHWRYLAGITVLGFACVLVSPSIQDRLVSITRPGEDPALQERLQRLTSSVRLGIDNPVLGIGYGRGPLKESLRPYLKGTLLENSPVLHTHNVYVEIFAETGLVGLLAFLWLLASTWLQVWRTPAGSDGRARSFKLALAASWIAAVVAGLGDVPFYHHETRIFFFTLLALAFIHASANRAERKRP